MRTLFQQKTDVQFYIILLSILIFPGYLFAQHSSPDTIRGRYITEKEIRFDGLLNDSIWQTVTPISNFTQQELDFGQAVSEKTQVAILYTPAALYFGIWCYMEHPENISAKNMERDFDYETDDNFQIIISPYNDNRNGYLFVINPNGAWADVLVSGGESGNMNWNGVWDTKTSINDQGWFAEVRIPLSTLQFKKRDNPSWAINFERDIASKNEQALWQGWSRDNSIFSVVKAGKLTGLKDMAYAKIFELKPYALAGFNKEKDLSVNYPKKMGLDLNVNLSPTLKLNLTSFTDFAQVESDRIQVNLSRFDLYYPEKRAFFLEGYDLYRFYLGNRNDVFYTRTLGFENGKTVPILLGSRLFGKVGKNNIGFLHLVEGSIDSITNTHNTIMRYQRDIGKQSSIGAIITNKINNQGSNQVLGLDATYQTSEFLTDKNLTLSGKAAFSAHELSPDAHALSYRFFIDYPNDLMDTYMGISGMGKDFQPELGFVRRKDFTAYNWNMRLAPRWFTHYGIKRLALKPWELALYVTQSTGEIESFFNETRPIGVVFKSGDRFEFNLQQFYERIDKPFDITKSAIINPGKYWMYRNEVQFETFDARRVWVGIIYNWGGYYSGKIRSIEAETGININKHFNLNISYTYNDVRFPVATLVTHELASTINYAFTTKINFSVFGQWNSLENIMIYNIKFHWIPKIGSDFYLVYNIGYEDPIRQIELLKPQMTTGVAKLVYQIMF